MSKRKKLQSRMGPKPVKTKAEQANAEGWIYVNKSKVIRGWNSIWVEEAQGNLGVDEERVRHP